MPETHRSAWAHRRRISAARAASAARAFVARQLQAAEALRGGLKNSVAAGGVKRVLDVVAPAC